MNSLRNARRVALSLAFFFPLTTTRARAEAPPPAAPPIPEPAPAPCAPTCTRTLLYAPPPLPTSAETPARETNPNDAKLLHGFRIGYSYTANFDKPIEAFNGQSLAQKTDMRTPNHFLAGYEAFYRMVGHSWLNVILVANANIAGLEQAKFYPSGNLLIGGEIDNSFQIGVGAHLEPLAGSEAHMIVAAGWTPRVGTFYVPLHVFFIPDVDGVHRMGVTTGVTW
jgi:hypothetical protein